MLKFTTCLCCLLCIVFQPIKAQNSLHFDGVDDRVNCGNGNSLQFSGNSLTLEAWIYPTFFSNNVYENNIIVKEDNKIDAGFMLRTGDGGKLNFAIGDGTGGWSELTSSASVLSLNQWQHIAGTYDGTYMRLFVDGKVIDSLSFTGNIGTSAVDMTIGDHNSYSRPFYGNIDEVRVWETYRTQKQILDNYKLEFCSPQKGLVAYYKFNQGIAGGSNSSITSLTDYSGYGNKGTLDNFALTGTTSNWVKGKTLSVGYTITNVSITRCNSYTSPSKKYTWTNSGTYTDTVKNAMDCDSILKITLTINKSTSSVLNVSACKSYTSPSKRFVWIKSGKYYDRLTNSKGCDSNITVNLTFNYTTTNVKVSACNFYKSPSGKYSTFFSGTLIDTLPDRLGCDSILIIDVRIKNSSYATIKSSNCKPLRSPSGKFTMSASGTYTDTIGNYEGCDSILDIQFKLLTTSAFLNIQACSAIKSPSGKYTYAISGTYKDTIINKAGCDSLLTLYVKIGKPSNASISVNACRSYTVPSKKRILYTNGTYADTILNKSGCDSIIQIQLKFQTTYSNINANACKSYLSPSGKFRVFSNGAVKDTIKNKAGCDSIMTINVTIWRPNTSITQDGGILIAQATGVSYQWLDCSKAKSKIQGESQQRFVCWQNGSFTVEITDNGCKDTGNCVVMNSAGFSNPTMDKISGYPNPTNGFYTIQGLSGTVDNFIEIINSNGKLCYSTSIHKTENYIIDTRKLSPGIYNIRCTNLAGTQYLKMAVSP